MEALRPPGRATLSACTAGIHEARILLSSPPDAVLEPDLGHIRKQAAYLGAGHEPGFLIASER